MSVNLNDKQQHSGNVSKAPLHRMIAEQLAGRLTGGQLKPGQKLPSERRIAAQFSASRATVRTALGHLEQAGLITRRDRRSAIVSIRRDITPHIRIACGSSRLLNLFRQLADMQILPPRCQIQLLDLHQRDVVGHILMPPASGADILFCDLEYARSLCSRQDVFHSLPGRLPADAGLKEALARPFRENSQYHVIPLAVSPMVLYYNRAMFSDNQIDEPASPWSWEQLRQKAQGFTGHGGYGFQMRPTYSHIAGMMARRGGELYQSNGTVAAQSSALFNETLKFIFELLHINKVSPLLAKVDQINLFALGRCAMAMDGFESFNFYRRQLGEDLGVTVLPGISDDGSISSGFVALVLAGRDNLQPIEDMIRTLLSRQTQIALAQIGAGLPVRADLLNSDTLEETGVPAEIAELFINEANNFRMTRLPGSLGHKIEVENLFMEFWLGLDNFVSICRRFRELPGR